MTRVLVTGGAGFVGRAVVRLAREAGYAVTVASRRLLDSEQVAADVTSVQGPDLGPDTDWSRALHGVDLVIHLAARVHIMRGAARASVDEFQRTTVLAPCGLPRQPPWLA